MILTEERTRVPAHAGVAQVRLGLCAAAVLFALLPGAAIADETLRDFSFTSLTDGRDYCNKSLRGNELVLVFGSIYCRPCIGLLPIMNRFQDAHRDKNIVVIGVDVDSTSELEKIRLFARRQKIGFPFFADNKTLARQYNIFMLPSVLFVDAQGIIVKKIQGPHPMRAYSRELEKVVERATASN